jgi:HEAT repeat protein
VLRKRARRIDVRMSALLLVAAIVATVPATRTAGAQTVEQHQNRATKRRRHRGSARLKDQIDSAVTEAQRHMEKALTSDKDYVRSDAFREARTLDEPWIAEIALPRCDSPDLTERSIALEVVAASNPSLARDAFLEALGSEERTIRLRGLLGLELLADEGTTAEVVEILVGDPDPDLREVAARTLGAIGNPAASGPLFGALDSDNPAVREQAVLSLVAIGESGLGEMLLERLQAGEEPGEVNLLRMLALIPDPSLVPSIEPYLAHDNEEVQTSAAATIFRILERAGYAH